MINEQNVRIQYIISEQTEYGDYNDALYFTQDEWDVLTEQELNEKVQQRVNNWVTSIEAAKNAPQEEVISQEVIGEVLDNNV